MNNRKQNKLKKIKTPKTVYCLLIPKCSIFCIMGKNKYAKKNAIIRGVRALPNPNRIRENIIIKGRITSIKRRFMLLNLIEPLNLGTLRVQMCLYLQILIQNHLEKCWIGESI